MSNTSSARKRTERKIKPQVAVIDDEPLILESYKDLLQDNYDIASFRDPKSFLQALSDKTMDKVDCVITDFKMPKMDGLEMIRRAQALGFRFPFVLTSGFLEKAIILQSLELGAFRLIEKPVDVDRLISTVDQLLIEHDLSEVREEIRSLTIQLRELYTASRLVFEQYVPADIMNRMIIDAPGGVIKKKMSFEDLLDTLEERLEHLLDSERILTELKGSEAKKT